MYNETGLLFPYFHHSSQDVQHLHDFCYFHKSNLQMGNLVPISTISEYDMGGEGDLFKAPEPIIEEPLTGLDLDPMTAALSMISCGEDISSQALKVADIESIQNEQLLSEVFYECKKDIMAKDAIETPFSEVLDIKLPIAKIDENLVAEVKLPSNVSFQKSVSSERLSSMDWVHGAPVRPNFLDFPGMDLDVVYGMRRAFSEGDIKALGNDNVSLFHSPRPPHIISNCTTEDRRQKLSRYWNKKTKRNFGRKIKYACRKALADSQPRIRGRFAKTEDSDVSRKQ